MGKKAFKHLSSFILPSLSALFMIFLFPGKTLPEPILRHLSVIDVPGDSSNGIAQTGLSGSSGALIPFFLEEERGGAFGYFDRDGSLSGCGRAEYGCAMGAGACIVFPKIPQGLAINDTSGRPVAAISGSGYPRYYAEGKRLFVFTSDLSALREINSAGITVWRRSIPAWITSVSANNEIVVVGLSSGAHLLLGKNGEIIREADAGASGIRCVYGTAVEQNGTRYAVLSGTGPRRISVMETATGEPVFQAELPDQSRTEKRMLFSSCRRYLFVEGDDSVCVIDLAENRMDTIFLPGKLLAFSYAGDSGILVLASRRGENIELAGIRPPKAVVFRTDFASTSRFLYAGGNLIAAGRNSEISLFETGEE